MSRFQEDLARMNAMIERAGAVAFLSDGRKWIDPYKVPSEVLGTFQRAMAGEESGR